MIDDRYRNSIEVHRLKAIYKKVLPYFVFVLTFAISYHFKFKYSESTNLFNDKLVDVCSIFFGIFIGCLYLFEKFRSNETYSVFLKFCKILLFQNIIAIGLSFVIILVNDRIPEKEFLILRLSVDFRSFLFSFYISLFATILYNIIVFIKIILIILKSIRQT